MIACTEARPVSVTIDERIGDDEGAERRAADDHELPRLPDHAEMTAERREASEQGGKGDGHADDEVHRPLSRIFPEAGRRARGLCQTGTGTRSASDKFAAAKMRSSIRRRPRVLTTTASYQLLASNLTRSLDNTAKMPSVQRVLRLLSGPYRRREIDRRLPGRRSTLQLRHAGVRPGGYDLRQGIHAQSAGGWCRRLRQLRQQAFRQALSRLRAKSSISPAGAARRPSYDRRSAGHGRPLCAANA